MKWIKENWTLLLFTAGLVWAAATLTDRLDGLSKAVQAKTDQAIFQRHEDEQQRTLQAIGKRLESIDGKLDGLLINRKTAP